MRPELVVRIGRDVVELVDRDQSVVKLLDAVLIHSEAKRRMSADEHLVRAVEKRSNRLHLATIVVAGRVTEVPSRLDAPVRPKSELAQWLVVKARANRLFRHDDDRLLDALVLQLVEGDEHQRAALPRGRRRFDKEILLATFFVRALLHWPHTQRVRLRRRAGLSV